MAWRNPVTGGWEAAPPVGGTAGMGSYAAKAQNARNAASGATSVDWNGMAGATSQNAAQAYANAYGVPYRDVNGQLIYPTAGNARPLSPGVVRGGGGGGGGGGSPPVGPGPNPGDFNAQGNRWMPGVGWQPPNMFSDLNWDYGMSAAEKAQYANYAGGGGGGGGGRGGGGGGGSGIPPVGPPHIDPVTGQVIYPRGGGNWTSLTLPENLAGALPEQYQSQWGPTTQNWLGGMGYTGMGQLGRWGETAYAPPPANTNPYYFAPSMYDAISDPTMRAWLQYIFGEYGYSSRVPSPTAPPAGH